MTDSNNNHNNNSNSDLDPDFLLEYLENEFLGFDFFDPVILDHQQPNPDLLFPTSASEGSRRHPIPLFRGIQPHRLQQEPQNRQRGRDEDLTPVPPRHSSSFDSLRDATNVLLSPTPPVYDVRFYLDAIKVQSLSKSPVVEDLSSGWFSCLGGGSSLVLSIKIYDEIRSFRLIRTSQRSSHTQGNVASSEVVYGLRPIEPKKRSGDLFPQLWEFADYFGSTQVEVTLEKRSRFSYQTVVLTRKSIPLASFFEGQKAAEKKQQYFSRESNYNWLLPAVIDLDFFPSTSGLLRRFSGSVAPSVTGASAASNNANSSSRRATSASTSDWWTSLAQSTSNSRKPRFSQPKYQSHTVPVRSSSSTRSVPASPPPPKQRVAIKLHLLFRLIFLESCTKQLISTKFLIPASNHRNSRQIDAERDGGEDDVHRMSEFQILVAKAPTNLVVEVMKSLAWRGILAKVLATPSSLGYWPLEVALRVGNASAVLELLQRTGYLCIPPLLPKHSSSLHQCIVGNSLPCYEHLQKFLSRYGGGSRGAGGVAANRSNLRQQQLYENLTWETCLEWKDGDEHTPFTLACSLPNRTALIKELLLAGVDVGEINARTKKTGLMYACELGDEVIVETLLSIQDVPKGEQELLDQIRVMNNQRGTLRLVSSAMGGLMQQSHHNIGMYNQSVSGWSGYSPEDQSASYPSPLSLANYPCLPNYREPLSGKQAIHFAAEHGHTDIVLMLLKVGVACGEVDQEGRTVYHIAVERGLEALVRQLIVVERQKWRHYLQEYQSKGYDTMMSPQRPLLIRNCGGKLPVDLAMDRGERKIARLLIDAMLEIYQATRNESLPSPSHSPLKGKIASRGASGSFVSLNLSSIRRQIGVEDREDAGGIMKSDANEKEGLEGWSNAVHLSREMSEWLQQLRRQLEGEPTTSNVTRLSGKAGGRGEEESLLVSRNVSPVMMTVSRSSSITGDGRELEDGKKEAKSDETLPSRVLPLVTPTTSKKTSTLRSYFSPFSSHWIGSLRGRRGSSQAYRSPTRELRSGESKDESVVLEEKEDEEEERERLKAAEEEEWNDTMEYFMALTPLSLRAIKPDVEL